MFCLRSLGSYSSAQFVVTATLVILPEATCERGEANEKMDVKQIKSSFQIRKHEVILKIHHPKVEF